MIPVRQFSQSRCAHSFGGSHPTSSHDASRLARLSKPYGGDGRPHRSPKHACQRSCSAHGCLSLTAGRPPRISSKIPCMARISLNPRRNCHRQGTCHRPRHVQEDDVHDSKTLPPSPTWPSNLCKPSGTSPPRIHTDVPPKISPIGVALEQGS